MWDVYTKAYDLVSQNTYATWVSSCVVIEREREGDRERNMGSGNGVYSVGEFSLDSKWLIDPKHLFVGPRIGEGAHAKVYEGK